MDTDDTLIAQHGESPERDTSRHTLTIKQASRLFASLGVPRSARSVQRFCILGSVDCILIKGDRTERYFVNQESVERYARELEHMEHISAIAADDNMTRHDVPMRDPTRNDGSRRDEPVAVEAAPISKSEADSEISRLENRLNELEK